MIRQLGISILFSILWLAIQFSMPTDFNARRWPLQISMSERVAFIDQALAARHMPAFERRPLVLNFIELAHEKTGFCRYGVAALLWFTCIFGICLLLCLIGDVKRFRDLAILQGFFITSFTIFFASLPPIETFSEPFQYLTILLGIYCLRRQPWIALAAFSLAAIERENTVFLVPSILFFCWKVYGAGKSFSKSLPRTWPIIAGALIGILWFSCLAPHSEDPIRYLHLARNFQDPRHSIESVLSVFLALGIPAIMAFNLSHTKRLPLDLRWAINAFWIAMAITVPLSYLTGLSREARIFALPLLLIWPYGEKMWARQFPIQRSFQEWALRSLIGVGAVILVVRFYHPTAGTFPMGLRLWASAYVLALCFAVSGKNLRAKA
jgi:hypothetical protein